MNEPNAGRAIVTFSRGWQTLVAIRSLGRRDVEVIAGGSIFHDDRQQRLLRAFVKAAKR